MGNCLNVCGGCGCKKKKKHFKIAMIGLDLSGKTTLLYKMKGEDVTTVPTAGINVETIVHQNVTFCIWDVGGQPKMRPLWKSYCKDARGIILVVDSCDPERMAVIRKLLFTLIEQTISGHVPILIYANKQDCATALPVKEVEERCGLDELQNDWFVQETSAKNGQGLFEGLRWLCRQ